MKPYPNSSRERKRNFNTKGFSQLQFEEENIPDIHLDEKITIDNKMNNYSKSFVSYPIMNRKSKKSDFEFRRSFKNYSPKIKKVHKSVTLHKKHNGKFSFNDFFENGNQEQSQESFRRIYLLNQKLKRNHTEKESRKRISVLSEFSDYDKDYGKKKGRTSININKKRANLKSLSQYLKKPTPRENPPLVRTDSIDDSEFESKMLNTPNLTIQEKLSQNLDNPRKKSSLMNPISKRRKKFTIKRSFTISKEARVEVPESYQAERIAKKMINYMKGKEDLFFELVESIYKRDVSSLKILLEKSN